MNLNRYDKYDTPIHVGDVLLNDNGKEYRVVFSEDILAFGIVDESNMFDFMSEWVSGEWEIIK